MPASRPPTAPVTLTALHPLNPVNPGDIGFDPKFILELALKTAPVADICAAYNVSREQLAELVVHPEFIRAYNDTVAEIRKDGVSFRKKCQLLSDELLTDTYQMIKDPTTPANTKADMIKHVNRMSGYETKTAEATLGGATGVQINILLGDTRVS